MADAQNTQIYDVIRNDIKRGCPEVADVIIDVCFSETLIYSSENNSIKARGVINSFIKKICEKYPSYIREGQLMPKSPSDCIFRLNGKQIPFETG